MNVRVQTQIDATNYERHACAVGVVHLGFGAFHRAHQAVFIDDYMEQSNDLSWGIAAVNLRGSEAEQFKIACQDIENNDGYYLKSISGDGEVKIRRVRSHVHFEDWSLGRQKAEALLAQSSVNLVTITVTESGYYTDPKGNLNLEDSLIAQETAANAQPQESQSVYGYIRAALKERMNTINAPITVACCDNIRQNGKMLQKNLAAYLQACGETELLEWVQENVAFPCSMVDRITPRSPIELGQELSSMVGMEVKSPILAEDFTQWVLQKTDLNSMPDLQKVDVIVTPNVDPYEETKIRVLNGGHTALAYLAALEGIETFDSAMRVPHLLEHFNKFEMDEVLPALTIEVPFSKSDYVKRIAKRFGNVAIGDTVARICADGMAKFPIFIRPTLVGCFKQDILPIHGIKSIASWHQFCVHVAAGKIDFDYLEPSWQELKPMLGTQEFITSPQLWGNLPKSYPIFAETLRQEISEMEQKWPV
ncbi:MAG: hypothetical protein AB8B49_01530 [Nitratireductor sp.]